MSFNRGDEIVRIGGDETYEVLSLKETPQHSEYALFDLSKSSIFQLPTVFPKDIVDKEFVLAATFDERQSGYW